MVLMTERGADNGRLIAVAIGMELMSLSAIDWRHCLPMLKKPMLKKPMLKKPMLKKPMRDGCRSPPLHPCRGVGLIA